MRKAFRTVFLLLLALALPVCALAEPVAEPRLPGPAVFDASETINVIERATVSRSPLLDIALSLLEEGNPFLARYNLATGAGIEPRLPFGVPYLYGGQTPSHVFAKAPDYVVQEAWLNSPSYFKKGTKYLYGFDCVGYVRWVWNMLGMGEWPGADGLLWDAGRHVYDTRTGLPDWETLARELRPGDILVKRTPDNHVAFFLGTLRGFGYSAEDVPELAAYLDYPLVIHSSTDAGVARRFDWLLKNSTLSKYRVASVTDGGVAVAILGVPKEEANSVFQQNQTTWYFTLPDGSWLSVLTWEHITQFCWWRAQ